MQRKRGLHLGRPFGFPLLVHRSWLGAGALMITHLAFANFGADPWPIALALGAVVLVGVFASVVLHEGAHALVRRALGLQTIDVTLFVYGGVPRTSTESRKPGHEAISALAGPLVSVAAGLGCVLAADAVNGRAADVVWVVGVANLALAAVNALPGLPLDGGRLLSSFLWKRHGNRGEGNRLAARAGQGWGIAAVVVGAWLAATSVSAFAEAALGLWLVLTGVFVASEASRAGRGARVAGLIGDATAGSWARPFAGRLRAETLVPADGGPYAVSDGARLAGILLPHALASAHGRRAGEVMIPWTPEIALDSDVPISSALQHLASTGTGALIILDAEGVVRGVLDSEGVRARLGSS